MQVTGPVANTGRYYKDAYEFAVERINAAGGIKIGSAQRKIALKILDNQSDVNLSVRQYVHAALSIADRGYVMETGEIVREGPAGELKNDPEVQRAYLGE